MTTANRSLATAPFRARFASGLLPLSYTTTRDVTAFCPPLPNAGLGKVNHYRI